MARDTNGSSLSSQASSSQEQMCTRGHRSLGTRQAHAQSTAGLFAVEGALGEPGITLCTQVQAISLKTQTGWDLENLGQQRTLLGICWAEAVTKEGAASAREQV